jgi:hypothetical protein
MVAGEWTVPDVAAQYQPGGDLFSAAWVGMDGGIIDSTTGLPTSTDVLQAGTESDFASGTKNVYVWWEWFPLPSFSLPNFLVAAGDLMYCTICITPYRGATWALFALLNETSGDLAVFSVEKPGDIDFKGDCAEWVVEAPALAGIFGNTTILPLADFGAVYIDEAVATTNKNTTVDGGDPSAALVSLAGQTSGQILAEPRSENEHLLKITRLSPADTA